MSDGLNSQAWMSHELIPADKREALAKGLRETFGTDTVVDAWEPITKGHTNSLVLRMVVRGTPYLLKIIVRAEDPSRHYQCMRTAAEGGIAPRVLYTDVAAKISVTDFVEAQALSRDEARVRMPGVLRALHALPPFAKAPFNTTCTFLLGKGPMVDGFVGKFREAKLMPEAELAEFFTRWAELAAAYPKDTDREDTDPVAATDYVASHNDLFKPDNILFDGDRVWLVDWEAAFLNERYADLAVVANQLVRDPADEVAFLREYLGAEPSEYQQARLYVMRQLAHLFYTMAFLFAGAGGLGGPGQQADWSEPAPEYEEFQRRMWSGEATLVDAAEKAMYARVHWERLMRNVQQDRYREALRMVAEGPPAG